MGDKSSSASGSIKKASKQYIKWLPKILAATNAQILPNELAQLEASQNVSPEYSQLQYDLYSKYGPLLNKVGSDINRQNALNQAEADVDVLGGPGNVLAQKALELSRITDPEYYKLREQAAGKLSELLNGGLTGGETEAIQRGLNQQGNALGLSVPTATNTVTAGMRFGGAERDRLNQALSMTGNMLPVMKSGQDTFMQVLGRPSSNQGAGQFVGARQGAGEQIQGTSNNLLNNTFGTVNATNQINSQRRDWLDRTNETFGKGGAMGSGGFVQSAGGALASAGM